ncbi:hypothetical protein ACFY0A_17755 [Streptomyces sp. NPDC001698]|uniref:hypothetical protein n=1 Tax=Streptomyces sp. NPDC001698 TaxID=3364601 RepID=UPI0036C88FE5
MTDSQYAVWSLLDDGEWHSTNEVNIAAGSSAGTRRLRELRAGGYTIEGRRKSGSAQHEYRLAR